jgi:DNA-binding transcriptional LysR family regulator
LPYAKAMLRDYRELLDAAAPCNSMKGTVCVGGGENLLAGTLEPVMINYAQQYPNVGWRCTSSAAPECLLGCARELDIGFHYLQRDERLPVTSLIRCCGTR